MNAIGNSIQDRFERFHAEHPEVYQVLLRLAREMRSRVFRRCGIKFLFERVRWFFLIERGNRDFLLNNDFSSRYARKLMDENPDLTGFFETRELKAA